MAEEKEDLYSELANALKEDEPEQEAAPTEKPAEKPEEPVSEPEPEAETTPEPEPEAETPKEEEPQYKFKSAKEFLAAVEDEPSRNLLTQFYGVIKAETSEILSPIERKNNEALFEREFTKYEKIEGLSDHKNDLRKTFLRNPKQSLKSLIGETVADLQLNKVVKSESTPSTPSREPVDINSLDKDGLYAQLDAMRT